MLQSVSFSRSQGTAGILVFFSILVGSPWAAQSGCLSDPLQECAFLWHQPAGSEPFERLVDLNSGRPLVGRDSIPGFEPNFDAIGQGSDPSDETLRTIANPLRGRLTPSPAPGVKGFLRYHMADPVINGVESTIPDFSDNPYLVTPDEFPDALLDFLPPELVTPGTTDRGTFLQGNGGKRAILTESESDTALGANAYGGDYSALVLCVEPGGLLEVEHLTGSAPQGGCLPFENTRAVGGTGELPLRPAPDLGIGVPLPGALVAQGLFIPRIGGGDAWGSCSGSAAVSNPRNLNSMTAAGIGTDVDCLKPGAPFASAPQNALEFHHANQQLFARLCFDTIGTQPEVDPSACDLTLLNSPELVRIFNIPFSELFSTSAAGEYRASSVFSFLSNFASGSPLPSSTSTPTQSLNRDANDGFITALHGTNMNCVFGSSQHCGNGAAANGGVNQLPSDPNNPIAGVGNLLAKLLPSRTDFITLDSGLTNEQRAMLGCGPIWGTRCDSSASMRDFDCTDSGSGCQNISATRSFFFDEILPSSLQRGGGIDALNADPVIFSAFPGIDEVPGSYITTSMAPAPGTVFQSVPDSFCERPDPFTGEPIRLPGCRGIDSYEITATEVIFTFEDGYDPAVDGCLVAPSIGDHIVRTVYSDGTDFTTSPGMMSCFGQLAPQTGDFDPGVNPDGSLRPFGPSPLLTTVTPCPTFELGGAAEANCRAQIAQFLNKANSDSGRGNYSSRATHLEPVFFAQFNSASTLYHPLAGCLTDDQIALQVSARPDRGPRCHSKPVIAGVLDPLGTPVPCVVFVPGCAVHTTELFIRFGPNGPDGQAGTPDDPEEFLEGFFLPASAGGELARDYDAEFLAGTAQIFKNELAVVSWNLLMGVVIASGCEDEIETQDNPACFDSNTPWALDRCSFNQPQHCRMSVSSLAYTNVPEPESDALRLGALLTLGILVQRCRKRRRRVVSGSTLLSATKVPCRHYAT